MTEQEMIVKAKAIATEAHFGVNRSISKEAYINHP